MTCPHNLTLLNNSYLHKSFPGTSVVMNPPAKVQSLIWDDPLEKEMATHSSILSWEIPWTEEPGGLHTVRGELSD